MWPLGDVGLSARNQKRGHYSNAGGLCAVYKGPLHT